jgi:hypothetical protein
MDCWIRPADQLTYELDYLIAIRQAFFGMGKLVGASPSLMHIAFFYYSLRWSKWWSRNTRGTYTPGRREYIVQNIQRITINDQQGLKHVSTIKNKKQQKSIHFEIRQANLHMFFFSHVLWQGTTRNTQVTRVDDHLLCTKARLVYSKHTGDLHQSSMEIRVADMNHDNSDNSHPQCRTYVRLGSHASCGRDGYEKMLHRLVYVYFVWSCNWVATQIFLIFFWTQNDFIDLATFYKDERVLGHAWRCNYTCI